ncbi:unnamed protein product [Urochloa humidicola]
MDLLCDTLMLEEVLPRVEPKPLLRLGATSRRYNALARNPTFAARYWPHAGVFLQPAAAAEHHQGAPHLPSPVPVPRFLAADPARPGLDLAKDGMAIVHSSSGGLLLCSRRIPTRPSARYYVFNPVTRQRTALLGLCYKPPQRALLTVAGDGDAARFLSFQVVVVEEWQVEDVFLNLKIFSSGTGGWKARHLSLSLRDRSLFLPFEHDLARRPVLGPSGAAYWIQTGDYEEEAIAFHSATNSLRVIHLPERLAGGGSESGSSIIGERHGGGGGLRFARAGAAALEVWDSEKMDGSAWALAHWIGITELLEQQNSELRSAQSCSVKPLGFHPTDADAVFLALPWGVAAYSMKHGTMDLQCTHNCFAAPADVFPYVHPPYPVQIPAIRNLAVASQRKRKADDGTFSSKRRTGPRR